ncbi:hypothetical protein PIB30_044934 [Stylosanthes scabra]|uniref:Transposase IS204/IS1001/IS1096/IS1165 DDE domain-containing protein n=1 Tax=Stylosanthes scabra TaxID=79078 RepID=A0ABU6ZES4_9FABA|nr:hypothetical protein [Stylosanthes scabra]
MSRFRNTRGKELMTNAAYNASVKGAEHYLEALEAHSPDMHAWALSFRRDLWMKYVDEGRRWGHMTTNLSECINSVLKGTRRAAANLQRVAVTRDAQSLVSPAQHRRTP